MRIEKETLIIPANDTTSLAIHKFLPNNPGEKILIFFPAMGVPARLYARIALQLAKEGQTVYLTDLRGCGDSLPRPTRTIDFGYNDLLYNDWPNLIQHIGSLHPGQPLILAGHSLGGQMSLLHLGMHPDSVDGLILLACCTPHFRTFPMPYKLKYAGFYLFSSLLATIFGFFPGDTLKTIGRHARQLIKDWTSVGLTGRFRDSEGEDLEWTFSRIRVPILSISFSDDTFAPRTAVNALLDRLINPLTDVTQVELEPAALGQKEIGHFGWMKNADKVVHLMLNWIQVGENKSK